MKKIIILTSIVLLFINIQIFAKNKEAQFNYETVVNMRIVEKGEACTIVELVDEDGNFILNVIAAVGTVFLPNIIDGICKRSIGDPDVCNTVFDVTSTLVDLTGVTVYKGVTRGLTKTLNWIANKGKYKSKAVVETRSYEVASGIKSVFETYKEQCSKGRGIPWESIDYEDFNNNDLTASNYSYSNSDEVMAIDNNTGIDIHFELSNDGITNWKNYTIKRGYTGSYYFYSTSASNRSKKGYIRINTDGKTKKYIIYTFRRYKIAWNEKERLYDVFHY